VRVTIIQLPIRVSLMLLTSLHLVYPELEALSFAEIVLWDGFIDDLLVLWHFVWHLENDYEKGVSKKCKGNE
jgi:hypothetical protein